jgi:transcription elongation GreA/GreB family factor
MSHSRMLTTRRRKQKGKKEAARIAKAARRLGTQAASAADADARKEQAEQNREQAAH